MAKPNPNLLLLAEACGARLTGKPDESEAIEVVFSVHAWRKFDRVLHRESNVNLPSPDAPTQSDIHTLRRLIECAQILDDRPRPLCRDCADEHGTCPNTGLDCDMTALFASVKTLHNKLVSSGCVIQPPAIEPGT